MATIKEFDAGLAVEVISRPPASSGDPFYGSGYYLGAGLAITCAHVLPKDGGYHHEVRRTDGQVMEFEIRWRNSRDDVALIAVKGWLQTGSSAVVALGVLPRVTDATEMPYSMFGWARARDDGHRREPLHINGWVSLAEVAGNKDGLVRLAVHPSLPEFPPEEWKGMSGAAAVCQGHVVAVQKLRRRVDIVEGRLLTRDVLDRPDERTGLSASRILGDAGIPYGVELKPRRTPTSAIDSFFSRDSQGFVMIAIVGRAPSAILTALRDAITLSRLNPRAEGAANVAVNASNKTAGEVRQCIAEPGPVDTLIIHNIDAAQNPEALVSEVIVPLVKEAPQRDMRVVLAFQDESVGVRLDLLAQRIHELREVESDVRRLRAGIAGTPDIQPRATELRITLTQVRVERARGQDAESLEMLASCERDTDRALYDAVSLRRQLEPLVARRNDLRSLLEIYRERASVLGENPELDTLYRHAHGLLWTQRCDLAAAAAAVERYRRRVHELLDERGLG